MTAVTVRMYRVGFGDCFLVTIGEGADARRLLIDCGRHAGSRPPGKTERTFEQTVASIIDDIAGAVDPPRLDVVVATHRHRDHVHGFSFGHLWERVVVGEVWLPWVENHDDPVATEVRGHQHDVATRTFHALRTLRAAGKRRDLDDAIEIAYNCTTNAAAYATLLRGFHPTSPRRVRYLPRTGRQPDQLTEDDGDEVLPPGVIVHVLGPSRDPAVIKRLDPPDGKGYLQLLPVDATLGADETAPALTESTQGTVPAPFASRWIVESNAAVRRRYGLTAKQVADVRAMRETTSSDVLGLVYRIDNAINGTSLVLIIEVGTVKLLFAGDAQWGTWEHILSDEPSRRLLAGTTLLKVGHHGSHNATPRELVETFLGADTRAAMIPVDSTKYGGGWQSIPKPSLLDALGARGIRVLRSDQPTTSGDDVTVGAGGAWVEIRLEG